MVDENTIRKGIARMYRSMGEICTKTGVGIEEDWENYSIDSRKLGYEFKVKNKKFQLILEFKGE